MTEYVVKAELLWAGYIVCMDDSLKPKAMQ